MLSWINRRKGARLIVGAIAFSLLLASAVGLSGSAKIGPELVFESAHTKKAWKQRMNLQQLGKWTGGDPQSPTADGEFAEAVALKDEFMKSCTQCRLTEGIGRFPGTSTYKVVFPNGYWIRISVDPGVVELQTPELTYEEYEKLEPFIQTEIHDRAASIGLHPPIQSTDGHSNFGVRSAFDTVEQLAEFILDQVNHPELAMGILGKDFANAPPLAILERFLGPRQTRVASSCLEAFAL